MNETEKGVGGREGGSTIFFCAVFCSRVSVIQYKDRADKDRIMIYYHHTQMDILFFTKTPPNNTE